MQKVLVFVGPRCADAAIQSVSPGPGTYADSDYPLGVTITLNGPGETGTAVANGGIPCANQFFGLGPGDNFITLGNGCLTSNRNVFLSIDTSARGAGSKFRGDLEKAPSTQRQSVQRTLALNHLTVC